MSVVQSVALYLPDIRTYPGRVQGPHVEDVDTLHLAENFQSLETGGLFEIGRDGTGSSTGGEQIVFGSDLCE